MPRKDISMNDAIFPRVFLFLIIVWSGLGGMSVQVRAGESDVLEVVRKHGDTWKSISSIQLSFVRHYKTRTVPTTIPNHYWESDGTRVRSITGHPGDTVICRDLFYDGQKRYMLSTPLDKYGQSEVRLCDYYALLQDEGYSATIIPSSSDFYMHLSFPIPRYSFVHTDEGIKMTLSEIVEKYSSKIVSFKKNASGDNLVEIVIESLTDGGNKDFGSWTVRVLINTDKGYHIEEYRYLTTTKAAPPVNLIAENIVKKYALFGTHWMPCEIESIQHNGDPTKGYRTSVVIEDCKINDMSGTRLSDFRFPANLIVSEQSVGNQPGKLHIWGSEGIPIRSFDNGLDFEKYYADECRYVGSLSENKYLAFRILMVILGIIMTIIAIYMLHAKKL